jgi:hypothetical protein
MPFKVPGFVDQAVKAKNFVPCADYNVTADWSKNAKISSRGAFLKKDRITFTLETAN